MKTLAQNLKTLMKRLGISESELSRKTQIGQPVIHRIASGETDNPKLRTLRPLARFFSLTLSQLVGDDPIPDSAEIEWPVPGGKVVRVPLLTFEEVLQRGRPGHPVNPAGRTFVTDLPVSEGSFAIELQDSTMRPLLPEGTVCIIDPHRPPKDRDFVVVHRRGQKLAAFKRYLVDGGDRYLKTLNADLPAIAMDNDYKVLGTMVEARVDFEA